MAEETRTMDIDIISDVMCPWCYIGKKNLENAISGITGIKLNIHWRPYQLDPTLPSEGKDRRQYLEDKFGGPEKARDIYKRVEDAGKAAGIDFRFQAIEVSPNTLDAHRVIRWAGGQGDETQSKLVSRLFEIYFLEGGNIGNHEILADAAEKAGMDGGLVRRLLASVADRDAVEAEIRQAQSMGVTGVPCFIIDRRYAVMGAQPSEVLAQAIRQADAENREEAEYTQA
ncbi:MAG: DsbA family oxidoreductase [Nitratireductor sp.]